MDAPHSRNLRSLPSVPMHPHMLACQRLRKQTLGIHVNAQLHLRFASPLHVSASVFAAPLRIFLSVRISTPQNAPSPRLLRVLASPECACACLLVSVRLFQLIPGTCVSLLRRRNQDSLCTRLEHTVFIAGFKHE